jgi:hypothetical protein
MNAFLRKKILFLIAMACCLGHLCSQTKAQRKAFIKDSTYIVRVKLVRPQFRVDNRNIFIKNQVLTINGLDAGVLLKDKLRLTLGYYWLNKKLSEYNKTIGDIRYEREINLKYVSLNSEFIYKNTRFFSLGMPLEIGLGGNTLRYVDSTGMQGPGGKSGFLVITDFGLSVTFKPIRWIGLKGVVGYRKTVFNQVKDFDFDGLFTSIGLNLDIREVVKDVQMFRLKKKYRKNSNSVETAVDLITD